MIQFNRIWKTYPREVGAEPHTALKGVTFSLAGGETLGLVGANGAGKSTCIRLLMDFIRPDKGEISLMGGSPSDHMLRRRIGYLPETASFSPNLSVLDMLFFTGSVCHIPRSRLHHAIEKWLKLLDLWQDRRRPLRVFSKGMQQRAGFAMALIHDPELLILDEPMSGLDPIGRNDIISLIQGLKKEGRSILFCSHLLEDVDRLVDSVLVLHKAESLFHGTPWALCQRQRKDTFVDAFLDLVKKEGGHGQ